MYRPTRSMLIFSTHHYHRREATPSSKPPSQCVKGLQSLGDLTLALWASPYSDEVLTETLQRTTCPVSVDGGWTVVGFLGRLSVTVKLTWASPMGLKKKAA